MTGEVDWKMFFSDEGKMEVYSVFIFHSQDMVYLQELSGAGGLGFFRGLAFLWRLFSGTFING